MGSAGALFIAVLDYGGSNPGVSGPYRIVAAAVFVPGSTAGTIFSPGASSGSVFSAGSVAGQVGGGS